MKIQSIPTFDVPIRHMQTTNESHLPIVTTIALTLCFLPTLKKLSLKEDLKS
uniref:Uncharacterized protein n=1 Tax=Rhizophora mucronata TaxID=61149 RepID=A0A2P2IJS0_RHIMU